MFTKKKKAVLLSAVTLSTWSGMAMAAKNVTLSSTISGWPLPIFLVGLIVFRKKIFHGHDLPSLEPINLPKPKVKKEPKKKEEVVKIKAKPKVKPDKKKAATKKVTVAKAESKVVDLTEGSEQCQASTSKGARCKRTNTLKNVTLVLDDTTYKLIVCAQHNNAKLKLYSELVK